MQGISFIVRSRNEASNLTASLRPLTKLRIPFEINVILHLCTDNSKIVLDGLKNILPIRLIEYNKEVSRAGYETFVTPEEHENSFITYSKFCFNTANYKWKFRWDADFFATPQLIDYLNNIQLNTNENIIFKIPCELGDTGILNEERYLSNCLIDIKKYMFWEVYCYEENSKTVDLKNICKINSLSYKHLKKYWENPQPWFFGKDQILTDSYNKLVESWGPEPRGMARASNPEADKFIRLASNIQFSIY